MQEKGEEEDLKDKDNFFNQGSPQDGKMEVESSHEEGEDLSNGYKEGEDLGRGYKEGEDLSRGYKEGEDLSRGYKEGEDLSRGYKEEDDLSRGYKEEEDLSRGYKEGEDLSRGYKEGEDLSRGYKEEDDLSRGYKEEEDLSKGYKVGEDLSRGYKEGEDLSRGYKEGEDLSRGYKEARLRNIQDIKTKLNQLFPGKTSLSFPPSADAGRGVSPRGRGQGRGVRSRGRGQGRKDGSGSGSLRDPGLSVRRSGRQRVEINYAQFEDVPDEIYVPGPLLNEQDKPGDDEYKETDHQDDQASENSDSEYSTRKKGGQKKRKQRIGEKTKNRDINKKKKMFGSVVANYGLKRAERNRFVYCEECKDLKLGGCSTHHKLISYQDYNLKIERSSKKGAGMGLWNVGKPIPKGSILGPYLGNKVSVEELESQKESNTESGYAWEIQDSSMSRVEGAVDPGTNPDPTNNPLAFANCGNTVFEINMIGVQFEDKIFYRTIKEIPSAVEMLVFYGKDYAEQLKIEFGDRFKFKGEENWSREVHPCTHCSSGFISQELLDIHLNSCRDKKIQEASTVYTCDTCNHQFPSTQSLKQHVKYNHGEFYCPECGEAFSSARKLKFHNSKVHLGETFPCEVCGKSFAQKSNLTAHVRNIHQGHRDYKCNVCGKEFQIRTNLTTHTRTVHELAKPYKCTACGKRFGQSSNLNKHIKSVHEGIKYPCTQCEFKATRAGSLATHIKNVHLGEYSFNCEYCDKGYNQRSHLSFHVKNHHPTEWFLEQEEYVRIHQEECNKCKKRFKDKNELKLHIKHIHNHSMVM
ncbi:histone-lysine N-methyltransferase PRDM9 [Eurytemora carolleeae]|uniref:histone-lysine N-methyltransferase PRDM9 n=1 Tax=Eurytemora carolleeae TaxID=1294199 RepID=UPI000C759CDE|nr:histone-lysine N-methyltransferase PRDM9 [Eurytemora carolleeae]|eukprot:XP_023347203.1 histone-lysine N-methyltransferase PRDM9-like [Eurytemora affinis]